MQREAAMPHQKEKAKRKWAYKEERTELQIILKECLRQLNIAIPLMVLMAMFLFIIVLKLCFPY